MRMWVGTSSNSLLGGYQALRSKVSRIFAALLGACWLRIENFLPYSLFLRSLASQERFKPKNTLLASKLTKIWPFVTLQQMQRQAMQLMSQSRIVCTVAYYPGLAMKGVTEGSQLAHLLLRKTKLQAGLCVTLL